MIRSYLSSPALSYIDKASDKCSSTPGPSIDPAETLLSCAKMAYLILVIGDLYIPDRAVDIPAKVRPGLLPVRNTETLSI